MSERFKGYTPPIENEELILGRNAVDKCLSTKRIGFFEISETTINGILSLAPKNETFTVPDKKLQRELKNRAIRIGRSDLEFFPETID